MAAIWIIIRYGKKGYSESIPFIVLWEGGANLDERPLDLLPLSRARAEFEKRILWIRDYLLSLKACLSMSVFDDDNFCFDCWQEYLKGQVQLFFSAFVREL